MEAALLAASGRSTAERGQGFVEKRPGELIAGDRVRMGSRALPLTKVTHLQMFTHLFSLCFDSDRSVEAFIAPHLCMQTKGAGIPVDLSAEASSCREPGRSRAEHRCRLPRAWCLAGNIHDFRRRGHMCLASSVCVPGHSEGDLVDRGCRSQTLHLCFVRVACVQEAPPAPRQRWDFKICMLSMLSGPSAPIVGEGSQAPFAKRCVRSRCEARCYKRCTPTFWRRSPQRLADKYDPIDGGRDIRVRHR